MLRQAVNLPQMDDYDAVLAFLNGFLSTQGSRQRLIFLLASQHVQYKLYLLHLFVLAEYGATGHVNFIFLEFVGDSFVVLIVALFWLKFERDAGSFRRRILLFGPAVLMLMAPRYSDNLNWAVGGLQNLAVIFFALVSLWLLQSEGGLALVGACASLVGAIAASGNGFVLAVTGLMLLWQVRGWRRMAVWCGVTMAMAAVYAYRYTVVSGGPTPRTGHALAVLMLFPFGFLGAASASFVGSVGLALLLLGYAGYLVRQGWRVRDPKTFFVVVFVLLTALGVTLTRHNAGLMSANTSRYAIYSQLLVVLLYLASLRMQVGAAWRPRWRRLAFATFAFATVLLFIGTELVEARRIDDRERLLREHYAAWSAQPEDFSLVPDEGAEMKSAGMVAFRARAEGEFQKAVKTGYYQPPQPEVHLALVRR
jgi:hypothetical protein